MFSEDQAEAYARDGFFIVRNGFSAQDMADMQQRLQDIVQGKFAKDGRRFQIDPGSGDYADIGKAETGYHGPDAAYRKIADLEYDDVFLAKLQSPWIQEVCDKLMGDAVSILRVTMMDKPVEGSTPLPWHQDVSTDWPTERQPELAMWFPLDKVSAASGSLQVIPGSHRNGIIGNGHLLPAEQEAEFAPEDKIVTVEMDPGDVLFFHAAILHRSGVNSTPTPRRAVNAILLRGYTMHTRRQVPYPVLMGENQLMPAQVAEMTAIPA